MCFFRKKKKNKKEIKQEKKVEEVEVTKVEEKSEQAKPVKKETKKTTTSKVQEKEKVEQKEAPKEKKETASKKPIYRVVYDKESRLWTIKKDGAKRTIATYVTKQEALNRVKELSASKEMSFVVHKKDGKFQKK